MSDDTDQVLTEHNLDKAEVAKAFKAVGIPYPRACTKTQRFIIANYQELYDEGYTLQQIADELNISSVTLRYNCKTLGLPLPGRTDKQKAKRVKEYLERAGGTITDAIRALKLKTTVRNVRSQFDEQGFKWNDYRYAFQRHGDWVVIPGTPERTENGEWIVPARCTRCGQVFNVSIGNIRSGNSNCCHICAAKDRKQKAVLCISDGTIFRSLRQMHTTLSTEDPGYQSIRKLLMKEGEFTSEDGRSFRFYHGDSAPNYIETNDSPMQTIVSTSSRSVSSERRCGVSKVRELVALGDF
ncbi:hypothetical protein OAK65_03790 [Synechococcus sp. AH-551-N17]|nr:hypothetical protein [Synechococcus sp. AH-551-N17]